MRVFFDIETNGLLEELTTIHCIMLQVEGEATVLRFDPVSSPVSTGLEILSNADEIVGHNIIGFDIPAIKKLHPTWTYKQARDTMLLTRLLWPDIKGSDFQRAKQGILPAKMIGRHSLESWGYRLGCYKGEFGKTTDWQQWTPEMSDYCEQDVRVIRTIWNVCQKHMSVPESVIEMEHQVQEIIARQERHGFAFNYKAAETLYARLLGERERLRGDIQAMFPAWYQADTEFTPRRSMKRKTPGGWLECIYEGAPMTKVKYTTFNPASNAHIAYWLIRKYDWTPVEFTEKSNEPKIDEDVLKELPYPEAPQLAHWWTLNKRCSQIAEGKGSWFHHYNSRTGRIHGAVNTIGAVTARMSHFAPNLAQVPANYSPFGEECRALFHPPAGYKQVGADAA